MKPKPYKTAPISDIVKRESTLKAADELGRLGFPVLEFAQIGQHSFVVAHGAVNGRAITLRGYSPVNAWIAALAEVCSAARTTVRNVDALNTIPTANLAARSTG